MNKIKQKIQNIYSSFHSKCPDISDDKLKDYGLEAITLRPYQLDGVQWLAERYHRQHGCILADEMGLGKTCQTISFLVYLLGSGESVGPHLILSPLSVMGNWQSELKRFAPSLKTLCYQGNKEERPQLQKRLKSEGDYNVVLTTYEICMKDESFLRKFPWHSLIVDEAHRLKNRESLLHKILKEFDVSHTILLTGTPVQNNLKELYSLLSFVASSIFRDRYMEDFVDAYDEKAVQDKSASVMSELHDLLKPFLLRRIKSEVVKDLPKKTEVILYHGMSALQKKYYKAILTKDTEAFDNPHKTTKTSLMNILMQLRKCVDHPYLFDGVEPEPFLLGDHLVEASGKLVLLDQLLTYLRVKGHKVLLFSQMTRMLDIVQDYLGYRGFTYERLDGSVRGEERYLAIQNFNEVDDTFIFLLSTKAGGQGLNLVSADTVIFLDNDFNPQNDLQAAARAHRIGQTRSVKVIRLVGRSTVEEIILKRAMVKLKLTHSVIEGGQFSTAADKAALISDDNFQLQDILKFGVDRLFADEEGTLEDVDLDTMLGLTLAGEWQPESLPGGSGTTTQSQVELESMEVDTEEVEPSGGMYMYEGTDYSKALTAADRKAFEELISVEKAIVEESLDEGRSLRKHGSMTGLLPELPGMRKARKQLTPEEQAARTLKRAETMARRAKEAEEDEIRRAKERRLRKEKMWKANGYTSLAISLDSEGEESEEEGAEPDQTDQSEDGGDGGRRLDLGYLVGDVTQPQNVEDGNAIIVHCVDDSGRWGKGGLFTALAKKSVRPEEGYELAGQMKDIVLGDVHLIPLDNTDKRDKGLDYCALILAQHRDKRNNLSGIKMTALNEGLQKIQKAAKGMKASVHLPRIGHNTPGFNWYGTERLIRKHLVTKGIPTYIYYYPRRQALKRKARSVSSDNDTGSNHRRKASRSRSPSPQPGTSTSPNTDRKISKIPMGANNHTATPPSSSLADFMAGVSVYFHEMSQEAVSHYHRHLVAYDGDMDEFMGDSTTHIVVPDDLAEDQQEDLSSIVEQFRRVPVVTESWLRACFKKQRLVPPQSFLYG